jgi:hypothetical protein
MRKQIPDTLLDDARKWSNRLDQDGSGDTKYLLVC